MSGGQPSLPDRTVRIRFNELKDGTKFPPELSEDGILTWSGFGDTGVYDIEITRFSDGSGLVHRFSGISDVSFDLQSHLDEKKKESGRYWVTVYSLTDDKPLESKSLGFSFVSSLPKLSGPRNLSWTGTSACWDSVPDATGYIIKLYNANGYSQLSVPTASTVCDFSINPNDGYWFSVTATADGYRDSNAAEGPKFGTPGIRDESITGGGSTDWNVRMDASGILSWNAVSDDGVYSIDVTEYKSGSGTICSFKDITDTSFDLKTNMDALKIDSKLCHICVFTTRSGNPVNSETVSYSYVSPFPKAYEPNNPRWNGMMAEWDSVPGAYSYIVTMYDESGKVIINRELKSTSCEMSGYLKGGRWFKVTAKVLDHRNSTAAESPKFEPIIINSIDLSLVITRDTALKNVLTAPENMVVSSVTWYRNGTAVPKETVTDAGKYRAIVTLNLNNELYVFGSSPAVQSNGVPCTNVSVPDSQHVQFTTPIVTVHDDPITAVDLSGSLSIGDELSSVLSVSGPADASLESVSWYCNGALLSEPGTARMGKYQAFITLKANDRYEFVNTTKVTVFGENLPPVNISDDGKYASFLTDTITLACDHSGDTSDWLDDAEEHWRKCSVCGKVYGHEAHKYGAGETEGGTTTYTCTDCGHKKTAASGNECIDWLIFNTPALVVGSALPLITPDEYYDAQLSITGYQWKAGASFESADTISSGSTVVSGMNYYLTLNCSAKSGYYFNSEARVKVSSVNASSVNVSTDGGSLEARIDFVPLPSASATVVFPALTVGKTMEAVFDEIVGGTISESFYGIDVDITENGVKSNYRINEYTSGWTGDSMSEEYSSFKTRTVQPGSTYIFIIRLQIAGASVSIAESDVKMTNASLADSTAIDINSAGIKATAIYTTEGDGKIISTAAVSVARPVTGNIPAATASGTGHFTAGLPAWSESPAAFAPNKAYTVTLTLAPEAGYTFASNAFAYVNGYPAASTVKSGDNLVVTYTFPKTGKMEQSIEFASPVISATYGDSVAQTVSANTEINYSVINGEDVASVDSSTGKVTMHKAGTAIIKAFAVEDDTYSSTEATYMLIIAKADGPAAPSCTFSFSGSNAGKLMGSTEAMEYSVDSGMNWTDCTANTDLSAEEITEKLDIQVRVKDCDSTYEGAIQTIDITKASAPSGLGKTNCTTAANNNGTITGLTSDMEYRKSDSSVWTSISGTTVTDLANGTYYVRRKAGGTVLASDVCAIMILKFEVTFDAVRSGTSLTVEAANLLGSGTVYVAEYTDGQMKNLQSFEFTSASGTHEFSVKESSAVKCFLVSSDSVPLCKEITR